MRNGDQRARNAEENHAGAPPNGQGANGTAHGRWRKKNHTIRINIFSCAGDFRWSGRRPQRRRPHMRRWYGFTAGWRRLQQIDSNTRRPVPGRHATAGGEIMPSPNPLVPEPNGLVYQGRRPPGMKPMQSTTFDTGGNHQPTMES